jgi:hypothetical protein
LKKVIFHCPDVLDVTVSIQLVFMALIALHPEQNSTIIS